MDIPVHMWKYLYEGSYSWLVESSVNVPAATGFCKAERRPSSTNTCSHTHPVSHALSSVTSPARPLSQPQRRPPALRVNPLCNCRAQTDRRPPQDTGKGSQTAPPQAATDIARLHCCPTLPGASIILIYFARALLGLTIGEKVC